MALEPMREIEPVLSSDAAVTLSDAERRIADDETPLLVSVPATVRLDPPSPRVGVEKDASVIGERAGRRHRGAVFEIEVAPAPIEASPVSALFDPSAVLSSMKASFPLGSLRVSGQAGDLPARELDRAVAGEFEHCRSGLPRCRIPRCLVTSRSAWLALEPVR